MMLIKALLTNRTSNSGVAETNQGGFMGEGREVV